MLIFNSMKVAKITGAYRQLVPILENNVAVI